MNVTIIGAGNGGYSHAFKIAQRGHDVTLVKTSHAMHEESFDAVLRNGGIWAIDDTDNGKKSFVDVKASRNIEESVKSAEIILVITQSLQHASLGKVIGPFLIPQQLLVVMPGYMGSVYFRQNCVVDDVIFAEGESLPYDARIVEPGVVQILFQNVRNPLAFMPAVEKENGLAKMKKLLERFYLRESIVESALHNPNLIVHTIGAIMNAARIEYSKGEFWMYREAFTPSIMNLVEDLDREKMNILKVFNLPQQSFHKSFQFRTYEDLSADSRTVLESYAYGGSPKGPVEVNNRYIYEDVPMGLCLMSSIGKKFGVETPIADALINIASSLLARDFWKEGRTLERLGLSESSPKEILQYFSG